MSLPIWPLCETSSPHQLWIQYCARSPERWHSGHHCLRPALIFLNYDCDQLVLSLQHFNGSRLLLNYIQHCWLPFQSSLEARQPPLSAWFLLTAGKLRFLVPRQALYFYTALGLSCLLSPPSLSFSPNKSCCFHRHWPHFTEVTSPSSGASCLPCVSFSALFYYNLTTKLISMSRL